MDLRGKKSCLTVGDQTMVLQIFFFNFFYVF